ncbi:MAG TPA: hypothetical protein VIH59_31640 [Candidatus Tectomicrobia bacterium]|jgi:hypothetical protein
MFVVCLVLAGATILGAIGTCTIVLPPVVENTPGFLGQGTEPVVQAPVTERGVDRVVAPPGGLWRGRGSAGGPP